jgi:hypothetical protein
MYSAFEYRKWSLVVSQVFKLKSWNRRVYACTYAYMTYIIKIYIYIHGFMYMMYICEICVPSVDTCSIEETQKMIFKK